MSRIAPPPSMPGPEFGAPQPGAPTTGTPTPTPAPPTQASGKQTQNAGDIIEITMRLKNLKDRNPEAVPFVEQIGQTLRDLQMMLTAAAPPVEVAAPPV